MAVELSRKSLHVQCVMELDRSNIITEMEIMIIIFDLAQAAMRRDIILLK